MAKSVEERKKEINRRVKDLTLDRNPVVMEILEEAYGIGLAEGVSMKMKRNIGKDMDNFVKQLEKGEFSWNDFKTDTVKRLAICFGYNPQT